jgi:glycosyltransferase involved in cell wall biosynthesis
MDSSQQRSLLILGQVWPEPTTTAAGERMMQLICSFQEAGYEVHFASSAERTEHSHDLTNSGVNCLKTRINDSEFDAMIRELQPDAVIFDRFMVEEQFGWRVAAHMPKSIRILNTEDLHSLRKARRDALSAKIECTPSYWGDQKDTLRELASIMRCDLSLIISKTEMNWLGETGIIPDYLLFYLPFMLDSIYSYSTDSYIDFDQRKDFVFVGQGKHAPNEDAVRFLKEDIWPLIRQKLPGVTLSIFGDGYAPKIQQLNDPASGFFICGWIAKLPDVMANARINLVPLRYGAGLKGKVISAIAAGTPSIITPIGAEGILPSERFEVCIANKPEEFAAKAVELYTNKAAWKGVQESMKELYNAEFDRALHHSRLHTQLEELYASVEDKRNSNIMGRMLQHQSLNSQKYMSKWIEAKNKIEKSRMV